MRALLVVLLLTGCTTTYHEITGTCVVQEWTLGSVVMRQRRICELPPPDENEVQVRDREAMELNPFPNLLESSDAETLDPNLLEKKRLLRRMKQTQDPRMMEAYIEMYNKLDAE